MNKKQKLTANFSVLPDEIQMEIFSYFELKPQFFTISCLSKNYQKKYSTKSVQSEILRQNGLFMPIFHKKFINILPQEFYREIIHPMINTKYYFNKLHELVPGRFHQNKENISLEVFLNINSEVDFPPEIQMFYTLCSKFEKDVDRCRIIGSDISNIYAKEDHVTVALFDLETPSVVKVEISLKEENFGNIKVSGEEPEILDKMNQKFDYFLKGLYNYLIEFENEEYDTFEENVDNLVYNDDIWRMFIDFFE
eukprot:gene7750-12220_t